MYGFMLEKNLPCRTVLYKVQITESVMGSFGIRPARHACYIAEIGLNHNGDVKIASRMIREAAGAGADAVKFQTFVPELMISEHTASLLSTGREAAADTSLREFFRRFVLSEADYRSLKKLAEDLGLVFFSSPFDGPSVDLLEEIGVPWYKIASSEVTNHPLIERIGRTGKPVIMSTGICTEQEIAAAIDLLRGSGAGETVLLHCVSLYPLPPEKANLYRIPALAKRFGCPVGFSDHTADGYTSVLASVLGARYFEKHFALYDVDCPDRNVSLLPDGFAAMIADIEKAVVSCGNGHISFGADEADVARGARRSLFAKRTIPAGALITPDDLVLLRPGVGMPASAVAHCAGQIARVSIPEGYLIRQEYFETKERKDPR